MTFNISVAIIFGNNKNKMIGLGLYDADLPIRIKIIHNAETKVQINAELFQHKIELAFENRLEFLNPSMIATI